MKHGLIIIGFFKEDISLDAPYETLLEDIDLNMAMVNISTIILMNSNRPPVVDIHEMIVQEAQKVEPIVITQNHLDIPFVPKPAPKVWPKDRLLKQRKNKVVGGNRYGKKIYRKRPF